MVAPKYKDTFHHSIFSFSSLYIDSMGVLLFRVCSVSPASELQYRSSAKHLLKRLELHRCWWHCRRNGLKVTLKIKKSYSNVSQAQKWFSQPQKFHPQCLLLYEMSSTDTQMLGNPGLASYQLSYICIPIADSAHSGRNKGLFMDC